MPTNDKDYVRRKDSEFRANIQTRGDDSAINFANMALFLQTRCDKICEYRKLCVSLHPKNNIYLWTTKILNSSRHNG